MVMPKKWAKTTLFLPLFITASGSGVIAIPTTPLMSKL